METALRLIVGLGNPAASYGGTRHNVGRAYIEHLQKATNTKFKASRQAEILRLPVFFDAALKEPLFCAVLSSYMNESGPALKSCLAAQGLALEHAVVIVDDFMIPFGSLRLRSKGSSGGHNGLNSIIETFGTEEFGRLRVGVGPVPAGEDPAEFVLKSFTKEEAKLLPAIFSALDDSIKTLVTMGYEKAMNQTNKSHL